MLIRFWAHFLADLLEMQLHAVHQLLLLLPGLRQVLPDLRRPQLHQLPELRLRLRTSQQQLSVVLERHHFRRFAPLRQLHNPQLFGLHRQPDLRGLLPRSHPSSQLPVRLLLLRDHIKLRYMLDQQYLLLLPQQLHPQRQRQPVLLLHGEELHQLQRSGRVHELSG